MTISNTVLKLNVKGLGDSLVWLNPQDGIGESEIERCFPHVDAKVYGSNVAFTGTRISAKYLFLTTTSVWELKDEFGRQGLTLYQGILFENIQTGVDATSDVHRHFEALTRLHKVRYQDIQSLLQYLATQGSLDDARKLAGEIFNSLTDTKYGNDFRLPLSLTERLRAVIRDGGTRLRVNTKFPFAEELGFFSLIGLLATTSNVRSVAGGELTSFEPYQHIATPREIPGYQYVDLNLLLAGLTTGDISHGSSSSQSSVGGEGSRGVYRRAVDRALEVANMPLTSTVLILCLGIFLVAKLGGNQNKATSPEESAGQLVNQPTSTPSPSPSPSPPAQTVVASTGNSAVLDETIALLYDSNKKNRQKAFSNLAQDKASQDVMVPRLLAYALSHPDQANGLNNTREILKLCDQAILDKNQDAYNKFLTLINNVQVASGGGGQRKKRRRAQPPSSGPQRPPQNTQPAPQRTPQL